MDISNNYTDQLFHSINTTIEDYDLLLDSYVQLSSDEIITSKKEILINVKHFIEDTFLDLISLKITLGEKTVSLLKS